MPRSKMDKSEPSAWEPFPEEEGEEEEGVSQQPAGQKKQRWVKKEEWLPSAAEGDEDAKQDRPWQDFPWRTRPRSEAPVLVQEWRESRREAKPQAGGDEPRSVMA